MLDTLDNASTALKARVAAPPQRRERPVAPPRHDATTLRLYEVHVKGFTRLHPQVPPELRGTYRAWPIRRPWRTCASSA